jgi:hypothetical protein
MTVTIQEFAKHLLTHSVLYYWANKTVHCRVLPDGRVRYWTNWEGDISREFASLEALLANSPAYLPEADDLTKRENDTGGETAHHVITDDEFLERFAPVKNHLNPNAPFDGCMFETFGAEFEHVRTQDPALVWTVIDCDGSMTIESGCHFVNRLGYLVASHPRPDTSTYAVEDDAAEADSVSVSRRHLRSILDYLQDSEADHYDPETYPDDVNNHVYAHVIAIEAELAAPKTDNPKASTPQPPAITNDVLCELAHNLTVRECRIRDVTVDASEADDHDGESRYTDEAEGIFNTMYDMALTVLEPYCEKRGAQ